MAMTDAKTSQKNEMTDAARNDKKEPVINSNNTDANEDYHYAHVVTSGGGRREQGNIFRNVPDTVYSAVQLLGRGEIRTLNQIVTKYPLKENWTTYMHTVKRKRDAKTGKFVRD